MDLELAKKKIINQSLREARLNLLLEEKRKLEKDIAEVKGEIRNHHSGLVSAKNYLKYRKRWIDHLNNLHPEITYVSGYQKGGNYCKSFQVLVKDSKTGIRFYVASSKLRQPSWKPNLKRIHLHKVFKEDREKWYPLVKRNSCGMVIHSKKFLPIVFLQCKYCGNTFEQRYGKHFCSIECAQKYSHYYNKRKKDYRTKKAKQNGYYDKSITLTKLYKRDHGICYICGKHLTLNKKYNRKDAPTIEHVIPICRGGTHTWDNVKLACRNCNNHKSTKTYQEYINEGLPKDT